MDIRAHTSLSRIGRWQAIEALEPRVLLDGTPMPDLALLDNPDNTVIRITTEFGDVDIELLQSDAPLAALDFLEHTQSGDYGQTFVHFADDFVLGAGLYRVNDQTELNRRFSPSFIDTTFVRSNVAQTLAMPVFDATTGQSNGSFIVNLEDNSVARDGEWVVFARIVQGFDAIEQIAAQPTLDLSQAFPNEPTARWLTSTPVETSDPAPSALDNSLVSNFESVSVIKQSGSSDFFTQRIYYPEGYSWERIFEAVDLLNPGEASLDYQIMVRYEVGQRDQTIATGSLDAGQLDTLVVSEHDELSTLVRNSTPYAYEIWSTAPMAASIRHADFGGLGGDAFFNAEAFAGVTDLNEWAFNQIVADSSESRSFLLWQNLSGESANLTVTFYYEDQASTTRVVTLDAHRRGGFDLNTLSEITPETAVAATISSDQPIVASLTRYNTDEEHRRRGGEHGEGEENRHGEEHGEGEENRHGEEHGEGEENRHGEEHGRGEENGHGEENRHGEENGHGEEHEHNREHKRNGAILALGSTGGGAVTGISSEIEHEKKLAIAILNPSAEGVPVTFSVIDENGSTRSVQLVMPANRLTLLDGKNSPIRNLHPHDEFLIRYEADSPLTVGLQAKESRGTGTPFSAWSAEVTYFADPNVYTKDHSSFSKQAVWIFNPGAAAVETSITLNFADMDPLTVELGTVEPGEWLVQRIKKLKKLVEPSLRSGFPDLKNELHSITIEGDAPLVVQTTQHDRDAAVESGLPAAPVVFLTTPTP